MDKKDNIETNTKKYYINLTDDNIQNIKDVHRLLFMFMSWKDTPQGSFYWSEVMINLEKMIGHYSYKHEHLKFNEELKDILFKSEHNIKIDKIIEKIQHMCAWYSTPQGHSYWSNVCDELKKIKE